MRTYKEAAKKADELNLNEPPMSKRFYSVDQSKETGAWRVVSINVPGGYAYPTVVAS